jgi:AraC-like DNA-binding protein
MFPQILYGLPVRDLSKAMPVTKEPYNTKKYIQSTVKNQEAFKILSQKILEYFEAEKPYLKQNFTLTELAAALHCPQHHISYCFSDFLDTSFTKLRSTKRIEYAQNLLKEGTIKDFTIDQIAEMSGFSSRSTFFSTFKEITGMTPTEFMEQSKSA